MARSAAANSKGERPTQTRSLPKVVVRNTALLAASQAVFLTVGQAVFILAALVTFALSGSAGMAGLASGLVWGGRVLIVYQSGRLMDTTGRRQVLILGTLLTGVSTVVMTLAVWQSSLLGFLGGLLVFGFGSGIVQQARIAVADMYPLGRRGEGIGYLMTGNVAGAIASTLFAASMIALANPLRVDVNVLILLTGSAILFASTVLIVAVNPEPREIADNIQAYYPDESTMQSVEHQSRSVPLMQIVLTLPMFAAFLSSFLSQGDMTMMMSLVSLVLQEHGASLTLISAAVTAHIIGMFALSIPLGKLADNIGRKWVVMMGGLILGLGAFMTPTTGHYGVITASIVLVGVGWSAVNVASTAMISDLSGAGMRGRVIGLNDAIIGLAAIALPVTGGLVIGSMGFGAFSLLGLLAALPVALVAIPLRETRPGKFD